MVRLVKHLWHSPTATTWAARAVTTLRVFLLLPLILTRFDDTEVAAWFVFGSIIFFASLLYSQTTLVFSRMIALAQGGAQDLSPIRNREERPRIEGPNWPLTESLYSTSQTLNALLALLIAPLLAALGYFTLEPLLTHYPSSAKIWVAYAILVVSSVILVVFQKYTATLRGLNQIALSSRWTTLFGTLSLTAGAITLLCGGGIVSLMAITQFFLLLDIFCQSVLLAYLIEPRFRRFKAWGWDKAIIGWAWDPLWRGIVQMLANRGGARVSTIALARYADPAMLAGLLLAVRLLETIDAYSDVPITSHSPRYGRLLGEGKLETLSKELIHSYKLAFGVQAAGILAVCLFASMGLHLIGSSTEIPPMEFVMVLALGLVLAGSIRKSLMLSIIGNHIVAVGLFALSAIVSTIMAFTLIPLSPFWGFLASAYLPTIFFVNILPLRLGCRNIDTRPALFFSRTLLKPLVILIIACALAWILPLQRWSNEAAQAIMHSDLWQQAVHLLPSLPTH